MKDPFGTERDGNGKKIGTPQGASELNGVVSRAHGRAVIAGRIEVVEEDGENFKTNLGLVLVFDSPEACRKALVDGCCTFNFGDG